MKYMRVKMRGCSNNSMGALSERSNTCLSIMSVLIAVICLLLTLDLACVAQQSITRLTKDGRSYTRVGLGWSPDGKRILFSKSFDEGVQLWVMNADGSNARSISRIGWQGDYGWAPDSRHIVFGFTEKRDPNSQGFLYIYDADTDQARQLVSLKWGQFEGLTGWQYLAWTSDSKQFAMLMNRSTDIRDRADSYLFDVESGKYVGLTPNNHTTGEMYPGSWSPDCTRLALRSKSSSTANNRVWICNRDGSELHALTPVDWYINSDPRWSPKGDWIAFCTQWQRLSDEKAKGLCDIWLVSPDGKVTKQLTHGSSPSTEKRWNFRDPEWTADGRYILTQGSRFDQGGNEYGGIYLVEVETGNIITVLEYDPACDQDILRYRSKLSSSPDGRKVSFCAIQYTVRGKKTTEPEYQDPKTKLYCFDIPSRTLREVLYTKPLDDGVAAWIFDYDWKPFISPDGSKMLFAQGKVISWNDWKFEPDLYVCDLEPAVKNDAQASATTPAPQLVASQPPAPVQAESPETFTAGAAVLIYPENRRASQIAESLPESYRGICRVDQGLNALVVSPSDEKALQAIRRDISLLDKPTPQIMVDVLVTELTDDASRQLGMNWQFAKSRWGATLPMVNALDAGRVIFQGVGKLDETFFTALSALEEKGQAIVKANPRILASCGAEAIINIRRTDNFLYESGTDNQGRAVRSRSDISADTVLKITPQLLGDNKIAMKLDATVDSFVFGAKNDLPDTTRRQATTDVACRENETVVIGGLSLEEETRKVKKTPILGDLPLIGAAFRTTDRSTKKSNLVIFVSPHIVPAWNNETINKAATGMWTPAQLPEALRGSLHLQPAVKPDAGNPSPKGEPEVK